MPLFPRAAMVPMTLLPWPSVSVTLFELTS
jgi:hypothetical protein